MSMNATKRKRFGLHDRNVSKSKAAFRGETVFTPDGKPASTLTAEGAVIIHDVQLLDAMKFFLPAGTKIIVGPHLSEVDLSREIQ